MKYTTLKRAVIDAKRFIRLADECEREFNFDRVVPGRRSGAVRRASMDLTRRLADLRQRR